MILVEILVSLVAPCIVPFYDFLLAKVNVPIIIGKNENSPKAKEQKLHPFVKGLPSAFIGNSIWGFTYGINDVNWVVVYFFIILWSIVLLLLSNWKDKLKEARIVIICTGVVLLFITLLRILNLGKYN